MDPMKRLYSIHWEKLKTVPVGIKRKHGNFSYIRITFLDAEGQQYRIVRCYEEWLGVCTNHIERVVAKIGRYFPDTEVRYERLGSKTYRKILPYFEDRLKSGKLETREKPFYKLYVSADATELGRFLHRYKIAYYEAEDWSVRLYVDLCTQHNCRSFYYGWYDVHLTPSPQDSLTDTLHLVPDLQTSPDWKVASFDIETVPLSGDTDRVPTGHDPSDTIVMMSVVKWWAGHCQEYVLYLHPGGEAFELDDPRYIQYTSEAQMLIDFHTLLQDCHVLIGYNILQFDLPCIMARLIWLNVRKVLGHYSSKHVGDSIVTTFQNKIVLDLYQYFKTFSNYDLPSFKLDDVAYVKLNERKAPFLSTALQAWYRHGPHPASLLTSRDPRECRHLVPDTVAPDRFGTFPDYLHYCLVDSQLVQRLFEYEKTLHFLVERANFASTDMIQALHYGNSRFLLEVLKTYGTLNGFFVNISFFKNKTERDDLKSLFVGRDQKTYQGALNWCEPESYHEKVTVLDFASMYPSALLSSNLCYSTCKIVTLPEYEALAPEIRDALTCIPYRIHSEHEFTQELPLTPHFRYPTGRGEFNLLINQKQLAFLPSIVLHLKTQRQEHQRQYKMTRSVVHKNAQLCIKILINSLYGIMASKDSPLAYLDIAMGIVFLSREQLLGSNRYIRSLGYKVCYADTDSLMVVNWPWDHCDNVNEYLNLPHVQLQFENVMLGLLILSKKKYLFRKGDGSTDAKGVQKKTNDSVQFMSRAIIDGSMDAQRDGQTAPADGWSLLTETLVGGLVKCHDPTKVSITRKTRRDLSDYKSKSCAAVKILQRYPERAGDYIDFTYSRADVAASEASGWLMATNEVKYVNFPQLFMQQRKTYTTILNVVFWQIPDAEKKVGQVLNTMYWKHFLHAQLLWRGEEKPFEMAVLRGVKYTFEINDHLASRGRVIVMDDI